MTQMELTINQTPVTLDVDPTTSLLDVLRNEVGLASPRFGCGKEQCGACRIKIDNKLVYACTHSMGEAAGQSITTVEGLGTPEDPHPLQQAVMDLNAGQCGFCLSGILITASKLLDENPAPERGDVMAALDDHLCRCGAHNRIIDAVLRAAGKL